MQDSSFFLGIDLGSTTVKYVLLNASGQTVTKDYVRHQSAVFATLKQCLQHIQELCGDIT